MKTALILVVFILVASIGAGYFLATSGQSAGTVTAEANETIFIHVVSSTSGQAIPNQPLTAGPASSASDLSYTPGGPTINECVHEVPNGSAVSGNKAVYNGTTTTFVQCPLVSYTTNATGWVTISHQNATYFFIKVGNVNLNNAEMVTLSGSQTYVTAPFPTGAFPAPPGGRRRGGRGRRATRTGPRRG